MTHPLRRDWEAALGRSVGPVAEARVLGPRGALEPGGLHCERLFGPTRELACRCGALAGEARRGERCPRCGVEVERASLRAERWAHVALPTPVVHPAVAAGLAARMRVAPEDVLDVARRRAWVDAEGRVHRPVAADAEDALLEVHAAWTRGLADWLGPEALFDAVPVPPPASRPLEEAEGGERVPGPTDRALARLVACAAAGRRLRELDAPDLLRFEAAGRLQRRFEAAVAALAGEAPPLAADPARVARYAPASAPASVEAEPTGRVLELAFCLGDRLAVVFDVGTAVVAPHSGEIAFAAPGVSGAARGGGDRALALETADGLVGLDPRGASLTGWPPGAPVWAFEEHLERGTLVDAARGLAWPLDDLGDYPALVRGTPDGRHVWVEDGERAGGVYRVEDGALRASPAGWAELRTPPEWGLLPDGRIARVEEDEVDELEAEARDAAQDAADALGLVPYAPHASIASGPAGFRVVFDQRVHDRQAERLVLGVPALVTALAPGGRLLALVSPDDELLMIDVEPPALRVRRPLAPLRRAAGGDRPIGG